MVDVLDRFLDEPDELDKFLDAPVVGEITLSKEIEVEQPDDSDKFLDEPVITPQPVQAPEISEEETRQLTFGEEFVEAAGETIKSGIGTLETAATLVTNLYGLSVSGLGGLAQLATGEVLGGIKQDLFLFGFDEAAKKIPDIGINEANIAVETISNAIIFQAQTKKGQEITDVAFLPFKKLDEVAQKAGDEVERITGSPDLGALTAATINSLPLAIPPLAKMRLRAKAPKPSRFPLNNAETEARFNAARTRAEVPLTERATEGAKGLLQKTTREFEHLPRTAEFAQLRSDLLKLQKQKGVASHKAVLSINETTKHLDQNGYDLFNRKVVLDDVLRQAELGETTELPFGYENVAEVRADVVRINESIAKSPAVADAVSTRNKIWSDLRQEYLQAMDDIGIDLSERFNNDVYFRRQVLEYAQDKQVAGAGQKLRAPISRGFLKRRKGTRLDHSTDYVQVEHDVMAQMRHDVEVARTIKSVDTHYNISEQLKARAKAEGVADWRELIPDTHEAWQPREGNVFYMADSIPAKQAEQLMSGALEEIGVTAKDLRSVLALGSKRRQFVLPKEVARTLDNLVKPPSTNPITQAFVKAQKGWKVWTLTSPRRVIKFNLRNITGDADAVFVGNPRGFLKGPRAAKELADVFVKGKDMTPEMADWFSRGGMESNLQAIEISQLNKIKAFLDNQSKRPGGITAKAWDKYWNTVRKSTDLRESILRYGNYLEYLEQIKKSPEGRPRNFGASRPEEIMALATPEERAYMLSNQLLGAYDQVSVAGQNLRQVVFPFWSWQEINLRRYKQFFANAASDGKLATKVGQAALGKVVKSPYVAYRVGKFAIKATAFWAALQAYNNNFYPELEKALPEGVKNRPHIILGQNEDGSTRYFSRIGALGDFLEWFGLDAAPDLVDQWSTGRRSLKQILGDMARSPVQKVVSGISPIYKAPAELASRRKFFPDVFKPGLVRNRWLELGRNFGLENEFIEILGLPSRGFTKSLGKLVYYETDPKEAAYHDIYLDKRRFMESLGRTSEGFILTPRGDALYNYKLARRFGDRDAMTKYLTEYIATGGVGDSPDEKVLSVLADPKATEQVLRGITRSIQRMHPLAGMNQQEQAAFVASLDEEQLDRLERAILFYNQTLLPGAQ